MVRHAKKVMFNHLCTHGTSGLTGQMANVPSYSKLESVSLCKLFRIVCTLPKL